MHDLTILRDLVILVAVAIPVVALAQRFRIATVVGFLLTGMVIGPQAFGLIREPDSVAGLAELGVVLLLFTIGLELSLSRIIRLGRLLLQGGSVQVVGTLAAVALLGWLLGVSWRQALFFGALVALSSTAVVLKIYKDRGELDTPHGRMAVAILLFQDLCVVPLMLLVPLLAGASDGLVAAGRAVAVSLGVVGALILGGRIVIPWILERVVGLANREIFTLGIVFFGLSAAYLTASFGLSLALGAFIAGLVISESDYGLQALSDVLPFRDTFTGVFFISIGMLLDMGFVASNAALILGITVAVVILKTFVAGVAARSLRRSLEVSLMTGMGLAQVGEFSFVLAGVALPFGLLPPNEYQIFLAASILTMLGTPFVIAGAGPLARLVCRATNFPTLELLPHEEQAIAQLDDHVIIVGYGLNGRNLARVLKAAGITYVVLEQNGQVVRRARLDREPIYFGDGTRPEVLHRVGIGRARALVLAIAAPAEERRGVAVARQLSSTVRIIVRTRYVALVEDLSKLGADEVIPEEFETSIEIFARVLRLYGVPGNVIQREVQAVRGERYEVLRGLSLPDLRLDILKHMGAHGALETVLVEEGAQAVGENPVSLSLRRETGAIVIAVVRDGVPYYTPDPEFRFRAGDTVVLVGDRGSLERATRVFRETATDSSRR
jgi:CPA2 family monovalent cation:H+ antiporter-2